MGGVASTLQGSGQSADAAASLDVAHAAAEAYGVAGDNAATVAAMVGDDDAVEGVAALVEVERAEIDPCRATHLLVHTELRRLPLMPHDVVGIVDAPRQRLVADIDGIAARLGDDGLLRVDSAMRAVPAVKGFSPSV